MTVQQTHVVQKEISHSLVFSFLSPQVFVSHCADSSKAGSNDRYCSHSEVNTGHTRKSYWLASKTNLKKLNLKT